MKYDNIHCLFQISSEKSFTKVQKRVKPTYIDSKEISGSVFNEERRLVVFESQWQNKK